MELETKGTYKGDNLQIERKNAGLTQAQLADAAGISVRVLQNYENNTRDVNGARLSTLLKLCNALGCELKDIISDPETLSQLEKYEERCGL